MSIAFMINCDDWLSSSDIAAMTAEEERGLLRLLMHLWKSLNRSGRGIPNDDVTLSRWALVSLRKWRAGLGARLRKLFYEVDGFLYNARLQREWDAYNRKADTRRQAASTAARARWDRPKPAAAATKGFERAGAILERVSEMDASRMPPASETDASRMRSQCATHATAYKNTEYIEASSVESSVVVDDPPVSLSQDGAENSPKDGAEMVPNADELKQAQKLLATAAKTTGIQQEPDLKIAAQILFAAGSMGVLVSQLAEFRQRDLGHVTGYGYFLRAIQARRNEPTARAG